MNEGFNTNAPDCGPMQMPPWLMLAWKILDGTLERLSAQLQSLLRALRIVRVLLVIGIVAVLGSAAIAILYAFGLVRLQTFLAAYALSTLFLVIPLVMLTVLVTLPLRARSVVRLIDKGYPENAKEIAIRVMARKLHDQSIATEELLWDTAVNEGKKVLRKMQRDEAESPPAPSESDAGSPP